MRGAWSVLFGVLVLLGTGSLWAGTNQGKNVRTVQEEGTFLRPGFFSSLLVGGDGTAASAAGAFQQSPVPVKIGRKSPGKALLLSVVLPGGGEFYARSWVKGALFLGVEIGSWIAYSAHKKKGMDWENRYKAWADKHWSKERWEQWWNSLSPEDQDVYAHHELPENKTQQYYEMIGKYQKFNAGWDDVNWIPGMVETDTSKASLFYMDMRANSNSELKMAGAASAVVLFNHVLSALDAVWSVRQFNRALKPKVRVKYVDLGGRRVLAADLQVAF